MFITDQNFVVEKNSALVLGAHEISTCKNCFYITTSAHLDHIMKKHDVLNDLQIVFLCESNWFACANANEFSFCQSEMRTTIQFLNLPICPKGIIIWLCNHFSRFPLPEMILQFSHFSTTKKQVLRVVCTRFAFSKFFVTILASSSQKIESVRRIARCVFLNGFWWTPLAKCV